MPKLTVFVACSGLAAASSALGQWTDRTHPAVPVPTGIRVTEGRFNAALQYHASWMMLEYVLEYAEFTPEELDAIDRGEIPEAYARLLEGEQEQIRDLIEATRLDLCDFGLNFEDGVGTLLPQLTVMRSTAKLLVSDARRLRGTDPDAAAERLAATIRLGEHAAQTSAVIGSLVGVAIVELARTETQTLLDAGELSRERAMAIDAALDRVLTEDPFHAEDALRSEAGSLPAWIRSEFRGRNAGRELAKLSGLLAVEDVDKSSVGQLQRMREEEVARQADTMALAYGEILRAWRAEDPIAEMNRIEERVVSGEYGPLSRLLIPALQRFRTQTLDAERKLTELRSELRAAGEG